MSANRTQKRGRFQAWDYVRTPGISRCQNNALGRFSKANAKIEFSPCPTNYIPRFLKSRVDFGSGRITARPEGKFQDGKRARDGRGRKAAADEPRSGQATARPGTARPGATQERPGTPAAGTVQNTFEIAAIQFREREDVYPQAKTLTQTGTPRTECRGVPGRGRARAVVRPWYALCACAVGGAGRCR